MSRVVYLVQELHQEHQMLTLNLCLETYKHMCIFTPPRYLVRSWNPYSWNFKDPPFFLHIVDSMNTDDLATQRVGHQQHGFSPVIQEYSASGTRCNSAHRKQNNNEKYIWLSYYKNKYRISLRFFLFLYIFKRVPLFLAPLPWNG